ncbi:hypothetical protein GGI01_001818 [Coemansia sp. RSA 376]|nr:hypothetical protein GGI01_001818 [Coemansia sp. RSA 376]
MVKQKPIDREKQKQVQEIEALLRASANTASKIVGSWLPSDDEDDADTDKKKHTSTPALKARDIFKGRPARLGVGAKFLSHKEMMSNSQSGPGILSAEELQLKRKLTKGVSTGAHDKKSLLAEKRKSIDDEADDTDSRSRIVGSSGAEQTAKASSVSSSSPHSTLSAGANMATKKKSKTSLFLDSLIKRRKK